MRGLIVWDAHNGYICYSWLLLLAVKIRPSANVRHTLAFSKQQIANPPLATSLLTHNDAKLTINGLPLPLLRLLELF